VGNERSGTNGRNFRGSFSENSPRSDLFCGRVHTLCNAMRYELLSSHMPALDAGPITSPFSQAQSSSSDFSRGAGAAALVLPEDAPASCAARQSLRAGHPAVHSLREVCLWGAPPHENLPPRGVRRGRYGGTGTSPTPHAAAPLSLSSLSTSELLTESSGCRALASPRVPPLVPPLVAASSSATIAGPARGVAGADLLARLAISGRCGWRGKHARETRELLPARAPCSATPESKGVG
jgi:hypothetical protein